MIDAIKTQEKGAPVLIAESDQITATALEAAVVALSPYLPCLVVRDFDAMQAQLLRQSHSALLLGKSLTGMSDCEAALHFVKSRFSKMPILLVGSGHDDEIDNDKAKSFGASGYAATDLGAGPLLTELRRTLAKCSDVLTLDGPKSAAPMMSFEGLSNAQRRVLDQLVQGKTNRDIADSLCLSEATIKSHLYAIYRIIGVKNRSQLILKMGFAA